MREFQQKIKTKKRMYSTPILLVLAVFCVIFIKSTINIYQKKIESEHNMKAYNDKVTALQNRGKILDEDIAKLTTKVGIEREIKEKFDVTEDGEYVAIIVDSKDNTATNTEKKDNVFIKLKNFIVSLF